jgi:hypothetical protein
LPNIDRLFETVESIPKEKRPNSSAVNTLAREGTALDHRITVWNNDSLLQLAVQGDPFTQVSFAYYYALQLFHCRNFTYYSCWETGTVPRLSLYEIEVYVAAIIDICDKIIRASNIPGVILLFPLRMAGAHVEFGKRSKILKLLQQIYNGGFVVAEKIKTDLCDFWTTKDLEHSI